MQVRNHSLLTASIVLCNSSLPSIPVLLVSLYYLAIGLPDLPYFTGAPVFQAVSPASRLKPIRETFSPVFWLLWILLQWYKYI